MTRWRHAGRGPKCTLLVGILLGVASLALYNSAYAATLEPPYPGSTALPGITNGPTLGCNPTGTSNETWVCGFNATSTTHFFVNGRSAGTYEADSNGCVLIVLSFSHGKVSINGNRAVRTRAGTNYMIIKGVKTNDSGSATVGVRFAFEVPHGSSRVCVTSPATTTTTRGSTGPPSSSVTTSTHLTRPSLQKFTTTTRYNPTTLAKVIETPLEISPNRVILESSLLAAVLAAILSAGALGSIWASEADPAAAGGSGPSGGEGPAGGGEAPPPPPAAPSSPSVSSFSRTELRRSSGRGGWR
jgi:hypothetical protein